MRVMDSGFEVKEMLSRRWRPVVRSATGRVPPTTSRPWRREPLTEERSAEE